MKNAAPLKKRTQTDPFPDEPLDGRNQGRLAQVLATWGSDFFPPPSLV